MHFYYNYRNTLSHACLIFKIIIIQYYMPKPQFLINWLMYKNIYSVNNHYFTDTLPCNLINNLQPFILNIFRECNEYILIKLNFLNRGYNLKIYFSHSKGWGDCFFKLSTLQLLDYRLYIHVNKLNYIISSYSFFEDFRVNRDINSIDDLKSKLYIK